MSQRAYVFDAYGTLLDVHAAIARHRDRCGPEADRLSELWRAKQLEYTWTLTLAGQYRDFWTLTEQALDHALARYPSVPASLKPRLLDAYRTLDAFPDALPCLTSLKQAGLSTAILSNGTPHMLSAALAASGIAGLIDVTLSVDELRLYKPRREVYAMALDALGTAVASDATNAQAGNEKVDNEQADDAPAGNLEDRTRHGDIVFVSSNRWDIMGAATCGLTTVWVNRAGLPDEYRAQPPSYVISDLSALPIRAD